MPLTTDRRRNDNQLPQKISLLPPVYAGVWTGGKAVRNSSLGGPAKPTGNPAVGGPRPGKETRRVGHRGKIAVKLNHLLLMGRSSEITACSSLGLPKAAQATLRTAAGCEKSTIGTRSLPSTNRGVVAQQRLTKVDETTTKKPMSNGIASHSERRSQTSR
ncbi:unnamed protein product [Soboliphyme baturini]|uniref:Uncharacterized protein n=1 Tax=Soboliphyme baturini TaxID=241478 RepID=A0A183IFD8_9BILA|nr:unnamed protein product [Soboliphyme baturini]